MAKPQTVLRITVLILSVLMGSCLPVGAQTPTSQLDALARELQDLRRSLDAVRGDLSAARRESDELRQQLQRVRDDLAAMQRVTPTSSTDAQPETVTQDQELIAAKVNDQEQTKVASGSRYRVRLSGAALLNIVTTRGAVDSLDLPLRAEAADTSRGSFGMSARQSSIGLEVFGPSMGGARTRGALTVDFFGGFPATNDGQRSGIARLRTTSFSLDWAHTSLHLGQEEPFFSPLSPTSIASAAYPALSGSGNLWSWMPQVSVERRVPLAGTSHFALQGGLLDPLSGEVPADEYERLPTAGERSRLPAEAFRVAWRQRDDDRAVTIGGGAYYSKQDWGAGQHINGWSTTADWTVPMGRYFALSGEAYRGEAMAGLGGGMSGSVASDRALTDPARRILPMASHGGWLQLKSSPLTRLELNAAYGTDRTNRDGLASLSVIFGHDDAEAVTRNSTGFINAIVQPRSNLMFSLEYRRLRTTTVHGAAFSADHISFTSGIVF